MRKFPLNIAHRGASSLAPENTMPAFKKAIELKCNGIELDVHLTKDEKVVVIHDDNLKRTTNGSGLVKNFTLKELKKLDAGSYFSEKFKNTTIPTLEEVMDLVVKHNILLDIEIKQSHPNIEKKVLDIIANYNYENNSLITSFNPKSILKVKNLNSNIKTGLLFFFLQDEPIKLLKNLNGNVLCADLNYVKLLSKKYIDDIHKNDMQIFAFTIDNPSEMWYLYKNNIDGIITNTPQYLNKLKRYPFNLIYKLIKPIKKEVP